VFLWPKLAFPNVLKKMHFHSSKSSALAKDLVFLNECEAINISKLTDTMVILEEQIGGGQLL
jgi:hypothetical protein